VVSNTEAAAVAALEELTDKIISGDADTYTEMSQGKDSEIIRVVSVLSEDDLRRTGNATNSTSAPTGAPTSLSGAVSISMTISLEITAAQFTDAVQGAFKTGVANSLGNSEITADHVTISTFGRRAIAIAFSVETPYTNADSQSSNIAALSTTLTSQMTSTDSGGFTDLFNTAAASAVTGWTAVSAPTITVAAAVVTQEPTAAPTATVVDSAPAGAGLSFLSMAAVAIAVKQLL